MKYRILKSIAHNFSHSFLSYTNYIDDGYIIEDLRRPARKSEGERINIYWIPEFIPEKSLPPRVLKSIANYKVWLPKHFKDYGADLEVVRQFQTDIFLKPNKQIVAEARLLDDIGKEHICNVSF